MSKTARPCTSHCAGSRHMEILKGQWVAVDEQGPAAPTRWGMRPGAEAAPTRPDSKTRPLLNSRVANHSSSGVFLTQVDARFKDRQFV